MDALVQRVDFDLRAWHAINDRSGSATSSDTDRDGVSREQGQRLGFVLHRQLGLEYAEPFAAACARGDVQALASAERILTTVASSSADIHSAYRTALESGQPQPAAELGTVLGELAEVAGDPHSAFYCWYDAARANWRLADALTADSACSRALAAGADHVSPEQLSKAHSLHGLVLAALDKVPDALDSYDRSYDLEPDPVQRLVVLHNRGICLLDAGLSEPALDTLRNVVDDPCFELLPPEMQGRPSTESVAQKRPWRCSPTPAPCCHPRLSVTG